MSKRGQPSQGEQICAFEKMDPGWFCCHSCGTRFFWVYQVLHMDVQVKCKCGKVYRIVVGNVEVK